MREVNNAKTSERNHKTQKTQKGEEAKEMKMDKDKIEFKPINNVGPYVDPRDPGDGSFEVGKGDRINASAKEYADFMDKPAVIFPIFLMGLKNDNK